MATTKNTRPPGSFFTSRGRWYWKVTLPGETARRTVKLCPPRETISISANRPEKLAWTIAWKIWRDAEADATGQVSDGLTVRRLVGRYTAHCETYYRRDDGTATGEATAVKCGLDYLLDLCGDTRADALGTDQLRQLREALIEQDLARVTINRYLNYVKRAS